MQQRKQMDHQGHEHSMYVWVSCGTVLCLVLQFYVFSPESSNLELRIW